MKRIKCKVCGKRFKPTADKRYTTIKSESPLQALTTPAKTIECFDCPQCGCQIMVNIREENVLAGLDLAHDETEAHNED